MTYSEWMIEHNPELAQLVGQADCSGELASKKRDLASIRHKGCSGQSESSFQRDVVIPWLHSQGWLVCEFRKARIKKDGVDVYRTPFGADGPGFPDLVAAHEGMKRVAFIEVKTDVGQASPNQIRWLVVLGKCDAEVYVVTPGTLAEFQERTKLVQPIQHTHLADTHPYVHTHKRGDTPHGHHGSKYARCNNAVR